MKALFYLLLVVLLPLMMGQKTICQDLLRQPIRDIKNLNFTSLPIPFLMYSGITTNNPGQLQQCLNANYSYFLVTFQNTTTLLQTFTGLCLPPECTAEDVETTLEFLHCKAYDISAQDTSMDGLTVAAVVIGGLWVCALVVWSIVVSCKEPAINQYLQNERQTSINHEEPEEKQGLLDKQQKSETNFKIFNYYEGYAKLFKVPSRKSVFSPIIFLAVLSFAASTEFSYRQTISENQNRPAATLLNSFWGLFVCNIQIALNTIMFVLGMRLAYGMYKVSTFSGIGRYFFDELIRKWLNLILLSLVVYFCLYLTQQPLSMIWRLNYGEDCPQYMWEIWFLFRNLQLDNKICLPWLNLLSSEILFTILAAPFIIIHRTSKKLSIFLFSLIVFTSVIISYSILDSEKIIFEPTKLMNQQAEYGINYQNNAFVRMGAFFFGLMVGLIMLEGLHKDHDQVKQMEQKWARNVRRSKGVQNFMHLSGLAIMILTYSLIAIYFDTNPEDGPTSSSHWFLVLNPLAFLIGFTLFIIPACWEGSSSLSHLIVRVLGWKKWVHLDRISITFYALAPMVIGFITYSMQSSIYYDYFTVVTYLLGDLLIIYILSVVCAAAFQNQLLVLSHWLQVKVFGAQSKYSVLVVEE